MDPRAAQLPNLEAAHAHALQQGEADAAVRIAGAPYLFVYHRLRADVGAWAEASLPLARRSGHPRTPVVAADDPFTVAHSRMSQGMTVGYAGRVDEGLELIDAVRREASEAGIAMVDAWCDFAEGELSADRQPERAVDLVDRAVAEADRAGWRMLAGVGRLTASSLRARTADPADAVPGFERLIRHWDTLGDETHQWTTLRNLVELLTRLGEHTAAARLLGAVSTATRPTFGEEWRRLELAQETLRAALGEGADAVFAAGREDDLAAAVHLARTTLQRLRGGTAGWEGPGGGWGA